MPNAEHRRQLALILTRLGIKPIDAQASQIAQFLRYSHHERLLTTVEYLHQRRERALEFQKDAKELTEVQQALLDPERIWKIAISDYNTQMRNYAFLYLAFNILEDSLRRAVDLHYSQKYGDTWYTNSAYYPAKLVPTGSNPDPRKVQKLAGLMGAVTGHTCMADLSLGDLLQFVHPHDAWHTHQVKDLFAARPGPEDRAITLPALSQCDAYEKLTILQWRRNAVYHHNNLQEVYTIPARGSCRPRRRRDGKFANTRDRIYEVMRYLGLRPHLVMTRITGQSDTLPEPKST
ncbi:hypothetical protein [Deinococcus aquatilis]|uniref:hypothetical protein n=1 Tax=Deinococcus aquatilis TaxID=519440 RepID=UPI0003A77EC7|nr:hypothetical protein [Deinococcus aquatilis]